MTNRNTFSSIVVDRVRGSVILTMTPQQAQLIAASIWLGDADHTQWLDELADLLRTNADGVSFSGDGRELAGGLIGDRYTALDAGSPIEADGPMGARAPKDHYVVAPDAVTGDADAVAAFARALTDAADADLEAAAGVEAVAVEAAVFARDAAASAADRTRHAAQAAKVVRAAATTRMAAIMAETVAQTALTLQLHTDEEARTVANAALEAASLVALSVLPGTELANSEKAASLAETIRAAAVAKAEETALAAAVVARAASIAAMEVAAIAADAAMALELEVADTAAAVSAVATATARQVAVDRVLAADLVTGSVS